MTSSFLRLLLFLLAAPEDALFACVFRANILADEDNVQGEYSN